MATKRFSGVDRRAPPPDDAGKDRSWHFEKRLSLDTLIAIVGIAVVIGGPLILAWRGMEGRVLKLETILEEQAKQDVLRDATTREQRQIISLQFKEMNDNLQKLQVSFASLQAQMQIAVATSKK